MGLHGGEWRVHASAVDDTALIVDSMQWLCGDSVEISIESEKSALGAIMYTIVGKMNSKASKESLGRVCNDSLKDLPKLINSPTDCIEVVNNPLVVENFSNENLGILVTI